MADVPRKIITSVLAARAAIPNVTVYVREIDTPPPTIGPNDLRVKPYVVVHPFTGIPGPDERLGGDRVGLNDGFQLTCVTGDEDAIDLLVDAVSARFEEWRPVLPAPYDQFPIGRSRQLNEPGPPHRDKDETPPRFWTPLVYGLVLNN